MLIHTLFIPTDFSSVSSFIPKSRLPGMTSFLVFSANRLPDTLPDHLQPRPNCCFPVLLEGPIACLVLRPLRSDDFCVRCARSCSPCLHCKLARFSLLPRLVSFLLILTNPEASSLLWSSRAIPLLPRYNPGQCSNPPAWGS